MTIQKFICLFLALLASCTGGTKPAQPDSKPLLLVSIGPYRTMVQTIAGDEFEVQTVVPLNANPHTYEPTSRQVASLGRGEIWFQIGEPFEQKMGPLLNKTELVDLRQNIAMIDTHPGHHCTACGQDHLDRHIWLSPKQAALQAELIAKTLAKTYPDSAPGFEARASQLKSDLDALDQEISAILGASSARSFLVSHPAFAYFCRDFGLTQLSIEQEGKEPRPKELDAIYRTALENEAEVAIALPQHNNKGAQIIAEKLRIPVRMVDPYSPEYFETMRTLAELIAHPYSAHE